MVVNCNHVRRMECDLNDDKADGLLFRSWKERSVTNFVVSKLNSFKLIYLQWTLDIKNKILKSSSPIQETQTFLACVNFSLKCPLFFLSRVNSSKLVKEKKMPSVNLSTYQRNVLMEGKSEELVL